MKPKTKQKVNFTIFILVLLTLTMGIAYMEYLPAEEAHEPIEDPIVVDHRLEEPVAPAEEIQQLEPVIEEPEPSSVGFTAPVTAYTGVESCHNPNCAMASGKRAYVGAVACPRSIPLGTRVEIGSLGTYICEDRTATYVDGRYDIFFGYTQEDYYAALEFGKQYMTITIL